MARITALACAAVALVGGGEPLRARPLNPDCFIQLARVSHPPRFEAYPAQALRISRPTPVRVASGEAHRYRTLLRTAAREGPNFAGRYRLAIIGCGSSCADFGIVDLRTGEVFFVPELRGISHVHVDDTALQFRLNSRLLVVEGAPREDMRREGVLFLEWSGRRFRTIRWVARDRSCSTVPFRG